MFLNHNNHRIRSNGSQRRSAQTGFTLVEVLASVIVLSIGLVGLARLQILGQQSNHSAYFRSQAVLQAYDMADRMRANRAGLEAGSYDSIDKNTALTEPACFDTTAGCSSAELADYDAWQWTQDNTSLLPSGEGTVTANAAAFTIAVTWDDDRDGDVDLDDPTFSMGLTP